MRILILSPRVPWPAVDGGRVAMARLAESLAREGAEIEVLSLNPRKDAVARVVAPVPVQAIPIDTSFVPRRNFMVARFESREFRQALLAALRRFAPDLVQIESPFLLPYAAECNAPVVLRSLNVEFRIWELLALHEPNVVRRFALRRVAASLRSFELAHLDTPDAIAAISKADADDFRSLGCTRPIHVAPCGVSPRRERAERAPMTAGFIGSLNFRPNQEAVRWIVDELWPRVLAAIPTARLRIAGSSPPPRLRLRGEGIEFAGPVADADAFVQSVSVMIAPLFSGGGMRIKVLEAAALGRPVVATTLGAGGVEIDDIVIANEAAAFADAVVRLLRDPETAARIGESSRAQALERYDSDRIARELLDFYRTTILARKPQARP